MDLKLLLVRNGDVLFEMPLAAENWSKEELVDELEQFEGDFDRFSSFFDALSNEARLRMMKRIFEDEDLTIGFADFMRDLSLNPKIVWESTRKLARSGLLEKSDDGKYSCSRQSQAEFLMVSLALRRLLGVLQDFKEW
jgi:DNA-binding transcriptional ArsR family regulator